MKASEAYEETVMSRGVFVLIISFSCALFYTQLNLLIYLCATVLWGEYE